MLFPRYFCNVSMKIWCFWNTLWRQKSPPPVSGVREEEGASRKAGGWALGGTPGPRGCLGRHLHRSCSGPQPLTFLFKPPATRGSRFLLLHFAIKRLWSEILSNGVRSILHRPPITIAEWWFSIAEFNSWLKNDRFHFPLLTQPATSWCSTSIFKIFPRFTVFSLFILQSNSRVYNA